MLKSRILTQSQRWKEEKRVFNYTSDEWRNSDKLNGVRLPGSTVAGRVLRTQTHHFLVRRRWAARHDHWNL